MTESFHESVSHEKDGTRYGLVECAYQDGHVVTLQSVEIIEKSVRTESGIIAFEGLVSKDNYTLEPHTLYDHEDIETFGNDLELFYSADGEVAIQTQTRRYNLSFMAIAQTLNTKHIEKLSDKLQSEQSYDILKHLVRIDHLKDLRYSLWLRLEPRATIKGHANRPVVARLDSFKLGRDSLTMIPYITDVYGVTDRIPELLVLGRPWLYIGVDEAPEPDGE